jgi:hypothetical protein
MSTTTTTTNSTMTASHGRPVAPLTLEWRQVGNRLTSQWISTSTEDESAARLDADEAA